MTFRKFYKGHYLCKEDDNLSIKHKDDLWIGYDRRVTEHNHIIAKEKYLKDIIKEMIRLYANNIQQED